MRKNLHLPIHARFAKCKVTRATRLHAVALFAVARAFDPDPCRTLKRRSFKSLIKVSACFVAEFKAVREDHSAGGLTVALQHKYLFFELFRRARDVLGLVPERDYLDDVQWTLERGEWLARALVNLAALGGGTDFEFREVERALTDLAGLATAICEWQMELTGDAPPGWRPDGAAGRADRLAIFLYEAATRLRMAHGKRVGSTSD